MTPHCNTIGIEELKTLGLGILEAFDAYCKEHGLVYWLAYGTLLGAARHRGYIPWDDDIDLMMPIEDYRTLGELHRNGAVLPAPYRLSSVSAGAADHHICFSKVYDTRTSCHQDFLEDGVGASQGAWIDILPIVGAVDSAERNRFAPQFQKLSYEVELCTLKPDPHARLAQRVRRALARHKGLQPTLAEYERLITARSDVFSSPLCYDPSFPQYEYRTAWFGKTITLMFEGRKFPAPHAYDEILTACYGDWRTLPPEDERIPHLCEVAWVIPPEDRPKALR